MRLALGIFLALVSTSLCGQTQEQIQNQEFYDIYESIYALSESKSSLTQQEAQAVMRHVLHHPIATILNPNVIKHYDPTGAIGFCFGRSMAVELAARKIGLQADSIKKIFVIGDMRSRAEPEWRFHVATLLKGEGGQWYALDPIVPGGDVLTAEQWLRWVRQVWDRPGKTNAYITDGHVVFPNIKRSPPAGIENNVDIMSTTFRPETHPGIKKLSQEPRLYDVSGPEAQTFQSEHFISTKTTAFHERFDPTKVTINDVATYAYNDYFLDLIKEFHKTSAQDILRPTALQAYRAREMLERALHEQPRSRSNELGSMRMDIIERDTDIFRCLF